MAFWDKLFKKKSPLEKPKPEAAPPQENKPAAPARKLNRAQRRAMWKLHRRKARQELRAVIRKQREAKNEI